MAARRLAGVVVAAGIALTLPHAASASTLRFTAVADTHVSEAAPSTSFGAATPLWTDASPQRQALLRFAVSGTAGRSVTGVRLRLYQSDASNLGGRVQRVAGAWDENTTWSTRPPLGGQVLASFGSVSSGKWYEVPLGSIVAGDGQVDLAIDSTSGDGAGWASRESATPPELLVDVQDPGTGAVRTVADSSRGSSDPTFHGSQHRLARTASGRLLTVHGRHGQGVQLAWRDPSGDWATATTGRVADGLLLGGTATGDWPASIAVARDSAGVEHAWVVWAGPYPTSRRSLQLVRLGNLDAPGGPSVGPIVTLDAPALGAYRPDVGFERQPDGSYRGAVLWSRQTGDQQFEMNVAWLSSLDTDAPSLTGTTALYAGTSEGRSGSFVATPAGLKVAARSKSSTLRLHSHATGAAPTAWTMSSAGIAIPSGARPVAAALPDGSVLVTLESDTSAHKTVVQRFSPSGAPQPVELTLTGYKHPTVTSSADGTWLLAVRTSDGYVVSRSLAGGWSGSDRIELGASGGGNASWPNTLRDGSGGIAFVVRGPQGSSTSRSAVLGYERYP